MKSNEYRKWYLIIAVFAFVFMFFGGSLAYWQWTTNETERTSIALTVKEDFRCDADGGGNISSEEKYLVPTDCTNQDYAIQRTITVSPTLYNNQLGVDLDLWLNVNSIGTGLKNSDNFKYALTTNSNSCTEGVVDSGNFKGKGTNSKLPLLSGKLYLDSIIETYYLYIWLDKAETNSATMEQEFDISLGGDCTSALYSEPEAPVLDDGMIPIKLSNTGIATTVESTDDSWYNYANKEWANVVLVNEFATDGVDGSHLREYYLNNPGTIVLESDILAYYVWIPRYKYQIWTTSVSATGKEQTINIVFEDKETPKSNGNAVGEYLTHPAFTFGDEELAGIWVGKFETTGNATTPTVKPNLQSLRNQNASDKFQTALKFAGGILTDGEVTFEGNNTYGLTINTDSHMIKNSEWGAVAYLSHSIYGINQGIYINNSSSYYTGRSGGNVGGSVNTVAIQYPDISSSTNQYYNYGYYTWIGQAVSSDGTIGTISDLTFGTKASTTGNVTGVYDMSGGSWEYTMGVLADSNGNPRSGNSSSLNSGFNGTVYDSGVDNSYTSGIAFPNSKYYDLYTTTDKLTACDGSVCYGHSLSETSSWYSDYAKFFVMSSPWLLRGQGYRDNADTGIFGSSASLGNSNSYDSWRSVLVVED